jgi:PST family polysaccharide transporter
MTADALKGSLRRVAGLAALNEAVTRVTRIVTAIALARALSVTEFGIAAAILTVHELTRMFIQNGLGTRIVAASDEELPVITSTIYWMNWVLSASLFALQIAIAIPVARHFGAESMVAPLVALAFVHIIYPFSMVQVYLAQRANQWGRVLGAMTVQSGADALLTALLAVAGFGLWSVVLPRLILAIGWILYHFWSTPWTQRMPFSPAAARSLMSYASGILGVEMLSALRTHADKVVVGSLLGPAALGLYAFASNIGNGITTGLSQSLGAVILPLLRHGREQGTLRTSYLRSLMLMLGMTLPLALAQAVLAPWYVPLLFGDKWTAAVPLLVILSLAALARPMLVTTSQMLRASHLASADFKLGLVVTALFFAGLAAGLAHSGVLGAAAGSTAGLFAGSFIALWQGLRHTQPTPVAATVNAHDIRDDAPLVSIVIASYNSAATISETLASVQQQTLRSWELLVIDDGSTDSSPDVLARFANDDSRIKLIRQPNAGPSAARNRGVVEARGRYVAFLDSDDVWSPDHLALTTMALERDPNLGISFGGCRMLAQSGAATGRHSRLWTRGVRKRDVLASNPTCTCSSLVIRKSVFDTAGMLRNDMKYAEDQEWLYRVLSAGWIVKSIAHHTVGYRTTEGGLSSQTEKMRDGWLQFVASAQTCDPALVSRHLPRARAMMELYFAHRGIGPNGLPAVSRQRLLSALRQWPWIFVTDPRRVAGLSLAILKSRIPYTQMKSLESPRHV